MERKGIAHNRRRSTTEQLQMTWNEEARLLMKNEQGDADRTKVGFWVNNISIASLLQRVQVLWCLTARRVPTTELVVIFHWSYVIQMPLHRVV